ncbi:hypothetical protein HOLleu_10443 [Holothuria leucospilota]|uniref:Uncharacterized protein n=1 Tax=Holothuria leucospilota TaxID=206669 RepID=A0A9Q1CF64_HOLLE|nr:hypothetical protein HOLleu_10443 [Holothuria leucospilota]
MVNHTDSPEVVHENCDFNLEYEFVDETPEPSAHTFNICECSWSRLRRETKSFRFSSRSDTLDGWKTAESEPQSRSVTPDKMRKRRRVHLLRFYPQPEAGKETRSESYVFLHHENWRQYMKQYRKYHTVGQAGRVNCEDLEWKNLLRHIKLGETFKELLFNSSASLHPPLKFPSMDHWCKEASQAIPFPSQKISQQREKREKRRNLFKSFNLASVKKKENEICPQNWTFNWRDEGLPQTDKERELLPAVGVERELHDGKSIGENWRQINPLSPTGKCGQDVIDFKVWREKYQHKAKGKKVKLNKSKAGPDSQISKTDIHANLDGVGVPLRTADDKKLSTILTGVNSFLPKEKVETAEYKVFQPHELGSLRLGISTASPLERAKSKNTDKLHDKNKSDKLRVLSNALTEKQATSGKKKSKKKKVYLKLDRDDMQSFSIMSYKQLDESDRMQMMGVEKSRGSFEQHTPLPRLMRPLSQHTVIWGNKYGTAEQHELDRRLGSPSAELF